MKKLKESFMSNAEAFNNLSSEFKTTSLLYLRVNHDEELLVSDSDGKRKFDNIKSFKQNCSSKYLRVIALFESLELRGISRIDDRIRIVLEGSFCGQFYNISGAVKKQVRFEELIKNYSDQKSTIWIYPIDKDWYYKKEPCFAGW